MSKTSLIGSISHKIGILELVLRNKIDTILKHIQGEKWLIALVEQSFEGLSSTELVSKQSLGFWLKVVEQFKIHNQIFDKEFLDSLDFKKYYKLNVRTFPSTHIMRHQKVSIVLRLLHLLRNRAFHFENLYKMNKKGPRLSVTLSNGKNEKIIISLQPDKIVDFLDDLLMSFHKDLVDYAKGGDKCPLESE